MLCVIVVRVGQWKIRSNKISFLHRFIFNVGKIVLWRRRRMLSVMGMADVIFTHKNGVC